MDEIRVSLLKGRLTECILLGHENTIYYYVLSTKNIGIFPDVITRTPGLH